jgi:hypothetical protein
MRVMMIILVAPALLVAGAAVVALRATAVE